MQNPVWSLSLRAWNTSPAGYLPAWDVGEDLTRLHQQHPGHFKARSLSRLCPGESHSVGLRWVGPQPISSMGVSDLQPDLRIPELDALLGSFQS